MAHSRMAAEIAEQPAAADAVQSALPLAHGLRLEPAVAVPGHLELDAADLGDQRLRPGAVAGLKLKASNFAAFRTLAAALTCYKNSPHETRSYALHPKTSTRSTWSLLRTRPPPPGWRSSGTADCTLAPRRLRRVPGHLRTRRSGRRGWTVHP
ncbi:hypothetical protein JOF55_003733 [Haloactinomyces albus]|uniref:Uncharacterized protein n=1 Tax=Haloactinomyces albus TaxID=1352928 RepID=A0AAE4CPY7_9ACTN|nr:hypothetical protein [Haloactinomyces albus]